MVRKSSELQTRDHPRGCGEHSLFSDSVVLVSGSSPRMRGALTLGQQGCLEHGIIPADAGSTRSWPTTRWRTEDHPRGCGEHRWVVWENVPGAGSSPRMRGALWAGCRACPISGIIPADAGSTRNFYEIDPVLEDHPRGCGEHDMTAFHKTSSKGSSPRMRGARGSGSWCGCTGRIIPADAGSTRNQCQSCKLCWDHPRGCGEHFLAKRAGLPSKGSSPRMRGAHLEILAIPTIQ